MKKFKELLNEVEIAKKEADNFFVNENMQAAKRFFASLMKIENKGKKARKELSAARKIIRESREKQNERRR